MDGVENTQTKQNYLRQHIILNGLSPDLFVEFLASKKEEGERIENWTLAELVAMVEAYLRLPHVAFPRLHKYALNEAFHKVSLTVEQGDELAIQLEGEAALVRRKKADVSWLLKCVAKEFPAFQFPVSWPSQSRKPTLVLEYLHAFNSAVESPSMQAFFRLSETEFQAFKNVVSQGLQAAPERAGPPLQRLLDRRPAQVRPRPPGLQRRPPFPPPHLLPGRPRRLPKAAQDALQVAQEGLFQPLQDSRRGQPAADGAVGAADRLEGGGQRAAVPGAAVGGGVQGRKQRLFASAVRVPRVAQFVALA